MRRHVIAGALGRLAPWDQLVEQARQDCRLAQESSARRVDEVARSRLVRNIGQRIDVERADDARIEALEIEHPHVAVQAGQRIEHVSALLCDVHAGIVAADARRDDADMRELAQVQEVERGDARGNSIRCHAGELAAGESERHQIQARDDIVGEPRIGTRIACECGKIVPIVVRDLVDARTYVAGQCFAFAQHLARHCVE